MFDDDKTAKIINNEIKRKEDNWLIVIAWILIFTGIIMFFTSARASDCISMKDANKKVRQNQKLISKLVYENRILINLLKKERAKLNYEKSKRSFTVFKTD